MEMEKRSRGTLGVDLGVDLGVEAVVVYLGGRNLTLADIIVY
jgi:hypothetical protein